MGDQDASGGHARTRHGLLSLPPLFRSRSQSVSASSAANPANAALPPPLVMPTRVIPAKLSIGDDSVLAEDASTVSSTLGTMSALSVPAASSPRPRSITQPSAVAASAHSAANFISVPSPSQSMDDLETDALWRDAAVLFDSEAPVRMVQDIEWSRPMPKPVLAGELTVAAFRLRAAVPSPPRFVIMFVERKSMSSF